MRTEQSALLPSLLTHYLSVFRRRRWLILGMTVGALLLGLLVTLLMTPQYTSSATLEIQRETRNFTNVEGAEPEQANTIDQEFYETQYGLLRSKSLADRVATSLRLYDDPAFFATFGVNDADAWFENGRVKRGAPSRNDRIRAAGDTLLDQIIVRPIRLSRLVEVSFTSPDAALSKRVVDAWGTYFIQSTLERRFEATSYARKFLESRLTQLQGRIDQAERKLVDYASREGIVNLPAATATDGQNVERSLVADDLATINRELGRATADRVQAESRAAGSGDAVTEALSNAAISGLRERRAQTAGEYAKLMAQFEPTYPPAEALQMQINQLDRSIAREESRIKSTLDQTYRASLTREAELKSRVGQLKSGVLDLRRRSIQYNIYQRDADTNKQLYDALLQRYKEIGVAGGVGVNNISVVDAADVPERPSSPRLLLNLVLALILGTVAGIGAALALEQIDEAIADPAELEQLLNVALLGTIPKVDTQDPMEELRDRKSALAEAYLSLLTNLGFATDHGVPATLAVTSTRPAEGKTTTSYALARSLARTGRKTLLLDCDMRSPSIHHLFGLPNKHGLSNFLSGKDDLESLLRQTDHDGLFVLTAGPQPPSAAELLSSDRLERLVKEVTERFDHVIFDAPPVMGFADAPLLGSQVEGTIFVLESHGTKRGMARVSIDRMRSAHAHIVGAVLTKFDVKRAHYGYGYNYGYGYGYGDGGTKTES